VPLSRVGLEPETTSVNIKNAIAALRCDALRCAALRYAAMAMRLQKTQFCTISDLNLRS
jgi:hypothetical protein